MSGVPADDRNLALRAARLVAQKAGYAGGVHLDVVKHALVLGGRRHGAGICRRTRRATRSGARTSEPRRCTSSLPDSARTCRSPSWAAQRSAPAAVTN